MKNFDKAGIIADVYLKVMPISPDRLHELSSVERYIFSQTKLNQVKFRDKDNLRLYLATYLVQNPSLSKAKIIGALPQQEGYLAVANHIRMRDVFLMHWLSVVTAFRTLRLVAKGSLVDPDIQESDIMKKRRRKRGIIGQAIKTLGIDKFANRHFAAPYSRAFNVIPFNVGDRFGARAMQSMQEINKEVRGGNTVATFLTGTKSPPVDLLDALPLSAMIALHNPDLPVIRVGISYNPFIIHIADKPITYRQVMEDHSVKGISRRDSITIMSRAIADGVGELIADPSLCPAWWLERNGKFSEEQLRLMSSAGVDLFKVYQEAHKIP